jgi:hypothetical protein
VPRKSGRLGDMAGSVMEYVTYRFAVGIRLVDKRMTGEEV